MTETINVTSKYQALRYKDSDIISLERKGRSHYIEIGLGSRLVCIYAPPWRSHVRRLTLGKKRYGIAFRRPVTWYVIWCGKLPIG